MHGGREGGSLPAMRPALLAVLCLAACTKEPTPPTVLAVQQVVANSSDAVLTVACPAGTRVAGGGCKCGTTTTGASGSIFGSEPAGNSWICGCTSNAPARADALCLGVSAPHSIGSAVYFDEPPPDTEAQARLVEYRRRAALTRE